MKLNTLTSTFGAYKWEFKRNIDPRPNGNKTNNNKLVM